MKKAILPLMTLALALSACGAPQSQGEGATTQGSSAAVPPVFSNPLISTLPSDPYATTDLSAQGKRKTTTPTTTTTSDPYNITLNFLPGSDQRVIDAMQSAASRWQAVITQGLPAVNVSIPAAQCGDNPAYTGTVDDILVFTGSKTLDGPGGVLAQSGPCSIRSASGLTVYSTLVFDSADLDAFSSQLPSIAMHELGHSLGIGSLWSYKNLTSGSGTTDPRYLGQNGNREYASLGGTLGYTPEENQGGSGTAEAHWRERTLGNELMTGYLNSGSNPLSRLSIGGLQDLGYSVDYSKAENFSISSINSLSLGHLDMGQHEEIITPKWKVD